MTTTVLRLFLTLLVAVCTSLALAAQSECSERNPFSITPSSTFCVDTSGIAEVEFDVIHNGGVGEYRVSFPDGTDTLYTEVSGDFTVTRRLLFSCNNPPGSPKPPTPDNRFYEYRGELNIVREDCVDDQGDKRRGSYDFNILPNPIQDIQISDLSCKSAPYLVDLDAILCSEDLVEEYRWYLNGNRIRGADGKSVKKFLIPRAGDHVIRLEVSTYSDKCETFFFEKPITITAAPSVSIDYTLDSADRCATEIVFPVNTTYQNAETFRWTSFSPDVSFSDPTIPNPIITIDNRVPGTRIIVLTASNEGCGDDKDEIIITTYNGQTIVPKVPLVTCSAVPYTFCEELDIRPDPATIEWTTDATGVDIVNATSECPEVTFTDPGSYELTASGVDNCGIAYSIPVTISVRDGAPLEYDFSPADTLCPTEPPVRLQDYVESPANIATITGPGVVNNTLDASNLRGEVTIEITDSCGAVYPIDFFVLTPGTFAGGNPSVCRGQILDLKAIQEGTYSGPGVENNLFSSVDLGVGTYTIDYRGADYCGGEGTFTITVEEAPAADFSISSASCGVGTDTLTVPLGEPLLLASAANAPVVCYRVLETGQTVCEQDTASIAILTPGTYTLQQTVGFANGACQDSVQRMVEVIAPFSSSAEVTVDSSQCDSLTLSYRAVADGDGLTYRWDFSTGDSSAVSSPSLRIARPVTTDPLRALLTVSNGCFANVDTVSVTPPLRFQVAFGVLNDNHRVCSGDTVFLVDNSVGATDIGVTLGDGTQLAALPATLVLTNNTKEVIKYPITMEGRNTNCPDQVATDTIYVLPVSTEAAYTLNYDQACSPAEVQLINLASPGASSVVIWENEKTPQVIGERDTLTHFYRSQHDTVFEITMVSRLCGIDTFSSTFAVKAGADATFDRLLADETACAGQEVAFAYAGEVGTQSLEYYFGDGSFSLAANPVHVYDTSGDYTVTLEVTTGNGCQAVDSLNVVVGEYGGEAITADIPANICVDAPFRVGFADNSLQISYDYGNDLRSASPIDRPYQREGTYSLTLTATDASGCSIDTTSLVSVYPRFTAEIQPPEEVLTVDLGDRLDLSFTTTPVRLLDSVRWWGDSLSNRDAKLTTAFPVNDGFYYLEVTDLYGCLATDSVRVNVIRNYGDRIYVPNVFSPNGDGANETFAVQVKPNAVRAIRSLRIFSRWGEMVYECTDCNRDGSGTAGWDGQLSGGRPTKPGVYVWIADIEFTDGEQHTFRGDVTLVR